MKEIRSFLNNYKEFVKDITATESCDLEALIARLKELENLDAKPAQLLTAGIGLMSESGEFGEIVKKLVFHGKEYDAPTVYHMKQELGDIFWYWTQACIALNLDPVSIITENVDKLYARHPNGKFDIFYSKN